MVIHRFSKAFENRIYLGFDLVLYLGVGWAYMLYTKPKVHIIKNLYFSPHFFNFVLALHFA